MFVARPLCRQCWSCVHAPLSAALLHTEGGAQVAAAGPPGACAAQPAACAWPPGASTHSAHARVPELSGMAGGIYSASCCVQRLELSSLGVRTSARTRRPGIMAPGSDTAVSGMVPGAAGRLMDSSCRRRGQKSHAGAWAKAGVGKSVSVPRQYSGREGGVVRKQASGQHRAPSWHRARSKSVYDGHRACSKCAWRAQERAQPQADAAYDVC